MKQKKLSKNQQEIASINKSYAARFGDRKNLTMFAKKQIAILTCMDSRMDPTQFAGFSEGDAFIIRNAGGRASDDVIRSLVLTSKLLGATEWFIIHHTNCGMQLLTDNLMRNLFEESIEAATRNELGEWTNTKTNNGSTEAYFIDWLTINEPLEKSIAIDAQRIRNHPLVSKNISIYGYIYDVFTGKLSQVLSL